MSETVRPNTAFDPFDVPGLTGTRYPAPFRNTTEQRLKRRLGDHGGLRNFGVNLVTLPPGTASALRHWHMKQDEFVYIVSGTPTLVTAAGSETMRPGACATFPAGNGDGHVLKNDTNENVVYLEVGDRSPDDTVTYPDDDLVGTFVDGVFTFTNRSGTPY